MALSKSVSKVEHALLVVEHIKKMIQKCKINLDELRSGHNPLPFTGTLADDLLDERYEYLENLQSKLQFILDYPERDQVV